jgi:hypothetical protein
MKVIFNKYPMYTTTCCVRVLHMPFRKLGIHNLGHGSSPYLSSPMLLLGFTPPWVERVVREGVDYWVLVSLGVKERK